MSDNFTATEKQILLDLAYESMQYTLLHDEVMEVRLSKFNTKLQQLRACFVTLHLHDKLRGCIGSIEAYQPLVADIVHNAHAAAFQDPRFTPLTTAELPELELHISVLSEPEPMQFTSEEDLITQLRPHIDGLLLQDRGHRGTFLPSVWNSLPEPQDFLIHLKLKAGLPADYWSDTIEIERYTVEAIEAVA